MKGNSQKKSKSIEEQVIVLIDVRKNDIQTTGCCEISEKTEGKILLN